MHIRCTGLVYTAVERAGVDVMHAMQSTWCAFVSTHVHCVSVCVCACVCVRVCVLVPVV